MPRQGRPCGCICYHVCTSTKDNAAAYKAAHNDVISALGEDAAGTFCITGVRVVQALGPKKWEQAVDVEFLRTGM